MRALFAVVVFLNVSGGAIAQGDARPEFEIASVKPAATELRAFPGGRLTVTNMTLKEMITAAWRIQAYQVSGGPTWIDSVRYDVSAKPESKFKEDELLLMVQSLLADRFQLKLHR